MRRHLALYLLALSFMPGITSKVLAEPDTFTTIDFPGATSTLAFGINPRGDIVGNYESAGVTHGFLLSGGEFTTVDFPGASFTSSLDINPRGDIVGRYISAGVSHGYLLSAGEFASIDFPGASSTMFAFGINPRGDIVGQYTSVGVTHGFLLSGGEFTTIDFPGSSLTGARRINPRGDIVGLYESAGVTHGFLLSAGEFTSIDFPGSSLTFAIGINPRGDIVGRYDSAGVSHGYLLSGDEFASIDFPGSSSTFANKINPRGDIVGSYTTAGVLHGFLLSREDEDDGQANHERRHLYVDAAAAQNGDGSRHRPFWRITNAVVRARELRQDDSDPEERIFIHVRPGTYIGSYDPSHLANNPRLELLPIIINVPDLSLEGGTELDEDAGHLPTGTYPPESETLLTTDRELTRGQVLLLIAATDNGMAGNSVSATGFVIDAQAPHPSGVPGFQIYADRVSDFSIRRNLLRQGSGFRTRLASGAFERNLSIANNPSPPPGGLGSTGMFITGGSVARPASVTLRRNRSTQNGGGASVDAVANFVQLDLGANTLRLEPLQMTYDLSDPTDQQNIPDKLTVIIEGNDLSGNTFFGQRCGFYPPFPYTTVDTTQPITGTLRVAVRNNRLNRNGNYGLIVDAFSSSRSNARQFTGSLEGTFEDNSLVGNGRNASLFGFTNYGASIRYNPRQDWKYMQESMFAVTDLDGELEGFDFDHPLNDPFDDSPVVGNMLVVNGQVQPNGIQITPLP